jgi:hypothetical protein
MNDLGHAIRNRSITSGIHMPEEDMSLRFRRNYPMVLLLIAILSFLALAMGNQPIIAYVMN